MRGIRLLALALVASMALILVVTSAALAAGPPNKGVDTSGNWSHFIAGWFTPADPYQGSFLWQYYDPGSAYAAFVKDGQAYQDIGTADPTEKFDGFVWAGTAYAASAITVTAFQNGPWGVPSRFTLRTPQGAVITSAVLGDGGKVTVSVPTIRLIPEAYQQGYRFSFEPVPEPSSLLALGGAMIGLIGMYRRRQH